MRAEHLQKCLREHRLAESATEVETKTVDETSGPEGLERATTEEWMNDGGEERETTKW